MKNSVLKKLTTALGGAARLAGFVLLALFASGAAFAQLNVYVANTGSNSLSVIDVATNTNAGSIPLPGSPRSIAINAAGNRAYVTLTSGEVAVVDLATSAVITLVPTGVDPFLPVLSGNEDFLYVGNNGGGAVIVIDTATNTVATTVSVAPSANVLALSTTPDGASVWATNGFGTVFVIDTATNTTTTSFSLSPQRPRRIVFTPDGAFAYMTSNNLPDCLVVDTATQTAVATIPTGGIGNSIAITPDGATVYQTNTLGGPIAVIDTATNTVATTLSVGRTRGIAVTPDGAFAYVANADSNSALVIDTATNTVVATVPVGVDPSGVAIAKIKTPQDMIEDLIAQIEALVGAGRLKQSNANPLINTLENADKHLDDEKVKQACQEVASFITKVEGAVAAGKLTAADGQALIDAANAIRTNLGCDLTCPCQSFPEFNADLAGLTSCHQTAPGDFSFNDGSGSGSFIGFQIGTPTCGVGDVSNAIDLTQEELAECEQVLSDALASRGVTCN